MSQEKNKRRRVGAVAPAMLAGWAALAAFALGTWRDFAWAEGLAGLPPSSLRSLGAEAGSEGWLVESKQNDFRVVSRQISSAPPDAGFSGQGPWCQFVLEGFRITQAVLVHRLPKARILDELVISVPVRCDKPSVRMRVRVVLPHSTDPSTGEPIRFYLLGPEYSRNGKWETLRFGDLPRLVNRHLFLLRAEHGSHVELRGAYVDQVGLIVYLGKGRTELSVGSPTLQGLVEVDSGGEVIFSGSPRQPQNLSEISASRGQSDTPDEGLFRGGSIASALRDQSSPLASSDWGANFATQPIRPSGGPWGQSSAEPRGSPTGSLPSAGPLGTAPEGALGTESRVAIPTGFETGSSLGGVSTLGEGLADGTIAGSGSGPGYPKAGSVGGTSIQDPSESQSVRPQSAGLPTAGPTPPPSGPSQFSTPVTYSPQSRTGALGVGTPSSQIPPAPTRPVLGPKVVGSALLDGFRPIFPRLIVWQGEPLLALRQLGVNGVWVASPPTAELLSEAARVGLWIVPQPIAAGKGLDQAAAQSPTQEFSGLAEAGWSKLLAWNLGHQQGRATLPGIGQLAENVRTFPWRADAPTVCHVLDGTREISRVCDILVFERPIWEEGLSLSDWADWLRRRQQLARPGTPFWCGIPLHVPPWVREQMELAGEGHLSPARPTWEDIRLASFLAIGAGARGLVFTTAQRIDSSDSPSAQRRLVLQLLQLELEMLDPFLAGGSAVVQEAKSPPGFSATVLRTERARLFTPLPNDPVAAEGGSRITAPTALSWTIPWVPEAYRAYLLLPGGMRPLRHRRAAGGVQVELDRYVPGGHVLLTNEPSIISAMSERASQAGPTGVSLLRRLVQEELAAVRHPLGSGGSIQSASEKRPQDILAQTQTLLRESEDHFRLGNYAQAWVAAAEALAHLRRGMRSLERDDSGTPRGALVSHPARWGLGTGVFGGQAASGTAPSVGAAETVVFAADFEDLGQLFEAGWRSHQNPAEPATVQVLLSGRASYQGRAGLELQVSPQPGMAPMPLLESPPVWIISPPLHLTTTGWTVISLWVNIPQPITGSVDGLLVADSFGGLPMGIRIRHTTGWQKVELYRRVPPNRPLEILIALTGYGQAFVDEMSVRLIADPSTQ
ncbi:MAG: hypothetical protein NZ899_01205 [Thermoguttaceae bacterium]|nr:hypothetical protein [Thermoguttaceae bacterium]MDW8077509.1 hypothetical protein [Thermoguttaceae bacterium]